LLRAPFCLRFSYTTLFRSLSSWVRGTDGEFLGYFTAWTYWAASIPYAVDSANEIIVDLGWAVTGTKDFQDKIPTSLFAILTFVRSEEHTSELQSRFDLVCR